MVNPFFIRVLTQVFTTLSKSAFKAYRKVISENVRSGQAQQSASSQFTDFLNKTMESSNLINKPMEQDEALKILNLSGPDIKPDQIMKSYENLFKKNDVLKGGSFYVQSKVFCAKEFLMAQYPGEEEKFLKEEKEREKEEAAEEAKKEEEKKEAPKK